MTSIEGLPNSWNNFTAICLNDSGKGGLIPGNDRVSDGVVREVAIGQKTGNLKSLRRRAALQLKRAQIFANPFAADEFRVPAWLMR